MLPPRDKGGQVLGWEKALQEKESCWPVGLCVQPCITLQSWLSPECAGLNAKT